MTSFDEVVSCVNKDFDLLVKKSRVSSKTENLILRMMQVYDNDPSETQANLKKFVHEVYEKNLKVAFMFWANPILLLTIKNMMKMCIIIMVTLTSSSMTTLRLGRRMMR